MSEIVVTLSGELYHADAAEILSCVRDSFAEGGCVIELDALEKMEFGPLQVLVAASHEARSLGIPFAIQAPDGGVFDQTLAVHGLSMSAFDRVYGGQDQNPGV